MTNERCHWCGKFLHKETDYHTNWWHYTPTKELLKFCSEYHWRLYIQKETPQ